MKHWVWQTDPVLFRIGPLSLHWYGLMFISGLLLGYGLLRGIYRREGRDPEMVDILFLYATVGILVGARLMHCLAYEPDRYLRHPLEILYFWKGGLASHGGMLGVIAAAWLFCRRYKESLLWLLSRMSIPGTLVAAFVRIGNFFNSEILGLPSDVPWAVVFARIDRIPRHPVQLYESAAYFLLFFLLLFLYFRLDSKRATLILPGIFLVLMFSVRFVLEYFKTEQADYVTGLPFTVGQLLSFPAILLGVVWLVVAKRAMRKGERV
ncbi:prolipoprotein diacylglyceryl transferase [Hydrogenimonas urashimensis]|uniref:prolipoprotein diacylglyceryl transferase n=1 Tax=Hydrogenimonas urashimensis TaxID=2740515 RepID=UPI001914DA25|nr:prolipoprotein diacylglyceryl transferase [Hydrogenimonas urashimensis]